MSRVTFLRADWRNLILANYPLPDELAAAHLPPGVELDRYEGSAYGSLVAFQFLSTRVLGVGWPGFRHFPEWNLRIYVRRGGQRGVCFVREWVPQRFVAWAARAVLQRTVPPRTHDDGDRREARIAISRELTRWRLRRAEFTPSSATGAKPAVRPGPDSLEHFFKEHSWGFGRTQEGEATAVRGEPPGMGRCTQSDDVPRRTWIGRMLYGPAWAPMNGTEPASVVLAAGGGVSVYPHGAV